MPGETQTGAETRDSAQESQVCAAIVSYNIGEAIHRCFDAIHRQVGHIILVDNGSDEATRRELEKLAAVDSVTLILNERNEGIAHAYNQAAEWARRNGFRWILTLDHDSEATPGMVRKLVEAFALLEQQGIQNAGVIGANPFDVNAQRYLTYGAGEKDGPPLEDEVEVISSGSLISLRVFDTIGWFNEDLFIYYVDTDFCMRLTRAGFGVYVCLGATLLHREGTRQRHRFLWMHPFYEHHGKKARYYMTRNLIYLIRKRTPTLSNCYWMVRKICKDHLKVFFLDKERFPALWYSLMGLFDGLRGKVGPLEQAD